MATRILVVDDSPTIRRVVSMILERHGYESAQATDGRDALDALLGGEVKADLVLVDFVMPRMNGFQFCRALREHTELAMTPVVLMSAKSDRIRDQFVQQTGAIDAITKPFDAQALVAVVENALRRISTGRISSARLPEIDPEDDAELDLVQLSTPRPDLRPPSGEVETKRTQIAQVIATRLAEIASEVMTTRPGAKGKDLLGALVERLSGEALLEMTEILRELAREAEHAPVLTGDLATVPVGAVLQLLAVENQTGVLVCTHAGLEVSTTFRNGLIDLVQSTGASDEFRLGRYFVEEGILTPQEIDGLLQKDEPQPPSRVSIRYESKGPDTVRLDPGARPTLPSDAGEDDISSPTIISDVSQLAAAYEASRPPSSDRTLAAHPSSFSPLSPMPPISSGSSGAPTLPRTKPLGTMLRDAGKVTQAQLDAALARQSSELLYDVLRWPKGRFELWKAPPSALADSARLGLPVASVVMEGFRRVDEWRVLERTLGSFDEVIVRDDAVLATLDANALPARERTILDLVDGERSVRSIVSDSHMSSFDACRILVQFLEARVLRRRVG
jgi:DNA-binding response OmpR family regulator